MAENLLLSFSFSSELRKALKKYTKENMESLLEMEENTWKFIEEQLTDKPVGHVFVLMYFVTSILYKILKCLGNKEGAKYALIATCIVSILDEDKEEDKK